MKARTLIISAWLITAFVATGCGDKGSRPNAARETSQAPSQTAAESPPIAVPVHEPSDLEGSPASTEPPGAESELPPPTSPELDSPELVSTEPAQPVPVDDAGSSWSPPAPTQPAPLAANEIPPLTPGSDTEEPASPPLEAESGNLVPPPTDASTTSENPAEAPVTPPIHEPPANATENQPPSELSDEPVSRPLPGAIPPPLENPRFPPARELFGPGGTTPPSTDSFGNPLRRDVARFPSRVRTFSAGNPLRTGAGLVPQATPAPPPRIPAGSPPRVGNLPPDGASLPLPATREPAGGASRPIDWPPPSAPQPTESSGDAAGEVTPPEASAAPEASPPEAALEEATPSEAEPSGDVPVVESVPDLGPDPANWDLKENGEEPSADDVDQGYTAPRPPLSLKGRDGADTDAAAGAKAAATVAANDTPGAEARANDPFTVVKVFYGTDRLRVVGAQASPGMRFFAWFPLFVILTLIVALASSALVYRWSRRIWAGAATAIVVVVLFVAIGRPFNFRNLFSGQAGSGPIAYGNGRGEMDYGEVEVTIPKSHVVGEVERPSVLRLEFQERSDRHIVIRGIERRDEAEFFSSVKKRVAGSPREDLFVFIHGYNVSFEMAARRTAQMAHDLQFEGAPIFYSWPSQGGLLQYPVDENNVAWTVPHLKQFLRDVVERTDAKAVNIIAHSMGNRALAAAIRELTLETRPASKQFHQIVLAAPDIDAEVFKRDIAPMLTQNANHVTLYASSRDQALIASKLVHGYPRAGDSGSNLVVIPGIETIDVTDIDTGILGHSYYGNSVPLLRDINHVLRASQLASERPWLEQAERDGKQYWVFEQESLAIRGNSPRR